MWTGGQDGEGLPRVHHYCTLSIKQQVSRESASGRGFRPDDNLTRDRGHLAVGCSRDSYPTREMASGW